MNTCSRCGDAILYCSCERTDPAWSSRPDLMENPSFWIHRGEAEVEWDRDGRALFGDAEVIAEIRSNLSGERQVVLHTAFSLLMVEYDPYALHLIAQSIGGCTFSKSSPKWGKLSRSERIYWKPSRGKFQEVPTTFCFAL